MGEEISLGECTFWKSDLGPAIKVNIDGMDCPRMTMLPETIKDYMDQVKAQIANIGESGLDILVNQAYQEAEKQTVPRFVRIFYLEYVKTAMACIIAGEYKNRAAEEIGSVYHFILSAYRNEREREEFKDNIEKAANAVQGLDRDKFFADLKPYNLNKDAGKTVATDVFKPALRIDEMPDGTRIYNKEDVEVLKPTEPPEYKLEPPEESTAKQKPVKAEQPQPALPEKPEEPLLAILDELTAEKPQEPIKSEILEEPAAPKEIVYKEKRYDTGRKKGARRSSLHSRIRSKKENDYESPKQRKVSTARKIIDWTLAAALTGWIAAYYISSLNSLIDTYCPKAGDVIETPFEWVRDIALDIKGRLE
jgi:hypothetical protein